MVKYKLVQGGLYYQCTQCGSTMKKSTTKTHARNCSKNPSALRTDRPLDNGNFPVINPALSELLKNQDSDDFRRKRGIRMLSKLHDQDALRENFIKDTQILADVFSGRYKPSPPSPEDEDENEENLTLAERRRRFYATLPLKYQNIDYFREEKAAMLSKLPEEDEEEASVDEEAESEESSAAKKPKKPVGYDRLKMEPELTLEVQRELLATKFRQREDEIAQLYEADE